MNRLVNNVKKTACFLILLYQREPNIDTDTDIVTNIGTDIARKRSRK
jgi:hypothetical protein